MTKQECEETMAKKAKSKKPVRSKGHHSKKKVTARHEKKPTTQAKKGWRKHATHPKPLLASEPKRSSPTKALFARKHKPPPREFVVAAEPVVGSRLPTHKKTKKKKQQLVLRFTENTLKDISALECVRRCFS
jgi:hypothetical protein